MAANDAKPCKGPQVYREPPILSRIPFEIASLGPSFNWLCDRPQRKNEEYTTNNQPFASHKDPTKNVLFDQTDQTKTFKHLQTKKQIWKQSKLRLEQSASSTKFYNIWLGNQGTEKTIHMFDGPVFQLHPLLGCGSLSVYLSPRCFCKLPMHIVICHNHSVICLASELHNHFKQKHATSN